MHIFSNIPVRNIDILIILCLLRKIKGSEIDSDTLSKNVGQKDYGILNITNFSQVKKNTFTIDWQDNDESIYIYIDQNNLNFRLYSYLHLSINILISKFNQLIERTGKNMEITKHLLKSINDEIQILDQISTYIKDTQTEDLNIRKDEIDSRCYTILTYNLVFAEYLIEKRLLIEYLQEEIELKAALEKDLKFHQKTYPLTAMAVIDLCILENRVLDSYVGIENLMNFVLSVLSNDITDRKTFFDNYYIFTLGFASRSLKQGNLDAAKKYTDFMITTNDILHATIEQTCSAGCKRNDFFNFIVFIDKFPVDNSSVGAYIFLHNLSHQEGLLKTAYVLVLERGIEMQINHPNFKLTQKVVQSKLLDIYRSVQISSSTYARLLVKDSSETFLSGRNEKKQFIYILRSNFVALQHKIRCIEKVIESMYDLFPNKVNEICRFIQLFDLPEYIYAGYKMLLNLLTDHDGAYNMEVLRLAHYIREQPNQGYFTSLKSKLPSQIIHLIWGKNCLIESLMCGEYLFPSKAHFINRKEINSTQTDSRYPYTSINSNSRKFQWMLRHDKESNTFLLKSFRSSYLTIGERFDRKKNYLKFLPEREEQVATKWKFQLVNTIKNLSTYFSFQIFTSSDIPLYLFSASSGLDNNTHSVFSSESKYNSAETMWKLKCTDIDKKISGNEEKSHASVSNRIKRQTNLKDEEILQDLSVYNNEDSSVLAFLERLNIKSYVQSPTFTKDFTFNIMHNFTRKALMLLFFPPVEMIQFLNFKRTYLHILTENIKIAAQNTFSVYKNLVKIKNYTLSDENFDNCTELLRDLTENYGYITVSHKIEKMLEYNIVSNNSNLGVEDNRKGNLLSLRNYLIEYFLSLKRGSDSNCITQLVKFKNFTPDFNLESVGIESATVISLICDALNSLNFHIGSVYFQLLNNESMIFYVFENLVENSDFLCHNIYNYFINFVLHLYDKFEISLEISVKVLHYSYKRLQGTSRLTETLKYFYSNRARYLMKGDASVLTDDIKSNLQELLIDKKEHLLKVALLIMKKKQTETLKEVLRNQFLYEKYNNDDFIELIKYMYKFRENKDGIKPIMEFLDIFSFFNNPQVSLFKKIPFFNIYRGYDQLVRLMVSSDSENTTQLINLVDYVYQTHKYIPCFHTECVDDIENIFPHFTRHYVEDKFCLLSKRKPTRYLLVSKANFVNGGNTNNTIVPIIGQLGMASYSHKWALEYIEENGTFLLKSDKGLYLSLGKRLRNSDTRGYKLAFERNKYENYPIEWKVELRKNTYGFSNVFTLRAVSANKTSLYLSSFKSDSKSGAILLSSLKSDEYAGSKNIEGHAEVWEIMCSRD